MHVRIANREDTLLQKQSDLGLRCLTWTLMFKIIITTNVIFCIKGSF